MVSQRSTPLSRFRPCLRVSSDGLDYITVFCSNDPKIINKIYNYIINLYKFPEGNKIDKFNTVVSQRSTPLSRFRPCLRVSSDGLDYITVFCSNDPKIINKIYNYIINLYKFPEGNKIDKFNTVVSQRSTPLSRFRPCLRVSSDGLDYITVFCSNDPKIINKIYNYIINLYKFPEGNKIDKFNTVVSQRSTPLSRFRPCLRVSSDGLDYITVFCSNDPKIINKIYNYIINLYKFPEGNKIDKFNTVVSQRSTPLSRFRPCLRVSSDGLDYITVFCSNDPKIINKIYNYIINLYKFPEGNKIDKFNTVVSQRSTPLSRFRPCLRVSSDGLDYITVFCSNDPKIINKIYNYIINLYKFPEGNKIDKFNTVVSQRSTPLSRFRPCLRVSSDGLDYITVFCSNDPKIINKIYNYIINLYKFPKGNKIDKYNTVVS